MSEHSANTTSSNTKEANKSLPQAVHQNNSRLANTLKRIKYKIFVMSGKGGVGKSSVAANLAVAFADSGFKTGILDVDLHGPSIPGLLGIEQGCVSVVVNGLIEPVELESGLKVISIDTLLENRNQAVVWRGPKKTGAIQQFITDANWGDLDFLIIDSPPGTGDEHLTILHMIPDALCLVVTSPQEIAIADVRKALNFLEKSNSHIIGIVENMSGFLCPHCGGKIDLFTPDGALELARQHKIPFLGSIPLDPEASRFADKGIPAVLIPGCNSAKSAFFALSESVKNASACFKK